ncbi:hypothetical protein CAUPRSCDRAFT_11171 [Caulochytrium protostelioides]|uniref:Uncharacterized protein n=1 Tax=Caulochytrium protostelioides TaxID=1555241 RepID=A0A4P9WUT6_9FUNG|nr:hypothetical protein CAUPRSCDRAFT_11171 [Caulochytrium protostelioides]
MPLDFIAARAQPDGIERLEHVIDVVDAAILIDAGPGSMRDSDAAWIVEPLLRHADCLRDLDDWNVIADHLLMHAQSETYVDELMAMPLPLPPADGDGDGAPMPPTDPEGMADQFIRWGLQYELGKIWRNVYRRLESDERVMPFLVQGLVQWQPEASHLACLLLLQLLRVQTHTRDDLDRWYPAAVWRGVLAHIHAYARSRDHERYVDDVARLVCEVWDAAAAAAPTRSFSSPRVSDAGAPPSAAPPLSPLIEALGDAPGPAAAFAQTLLFLLVRAPEPDPASEAAVVHAVERLLVHPDIAPRSGDAGAAAEAPWRTLGARLIYTNDLGLICETAMRACRNGVAASLPSPVTATRVTALAGFGASGGGSRSTLALHDRVGALGDDAARRAAYLGLLPAVWTAAGARWTRSWQPQTVVAFLQELAASADEGCETRGQDATVALASARRAKALLSAFQAVLDGEDDALASLP